MHNLLAIFSVLLWLYAFFGPIVSRNMYATHGSFHVSVLLGLTGGWFLFGAESTWALVKCLGLALGLYLLIAIVYLIASVRVEKRIKQMMPEYERLRVEGKSPFFVRDAWSVELVVNGSIDSYGAGYSDVSRFWSEGGKFHSFSMLYRRN
jgi:hypothetical protein